MLFPKQYYGIPSWNEVNSTGALMITHNYDSVGNDFYDGGEKAQRAFKDLH